MNSKNWQLRPIGQRSITSTPLFRAASNRSSDCARDVEINVCRQKGSRASLSDFLNRNLHRSHVLPTSVQACLGSWMRFTTGLNNLYDCSAKDFFSGLLAPKITRITCIVLLHYIFAVLRDDVVKSVDDYSINGKELHFSSPMGAEQSERGADRESVKKEGREAETKFSIDVAFNMFKNVERDKTDSSNSRSANENGIFNLHNIQQTRKRKNLNEDKPTAQKRLALLGENSKPVQRSRREKIAKEEPIPLFNHYKNGGGWWNDSMEGVDNDEVGCNNVWEGVGCTTLGGIEWH
ncbi:hypothetical protein CASFOL_012902 [Castilleja foliolosa]|uniref:Uncharacterized protein n=1 Tax=Castilleja foliolosa TaxID=1961234 RepID=A0ABD3DJ60_9LAMI